MNDPSATVETLTDYITGLEKPNHGAEANRQQMERLLVEQFGYDRASVEVDAPLALDIDGRHYASAVDLVVSVHNHRYMAIKCAAGSLASREREIIAAARLLDSYQIPLAVATDGRTAVVWDTISGQCLGSDLQAIPSAVQARTDFDTDRLIPLEEKRRYRQMLIFRSYDAMNIHR